MTERIYHITSFEAWQQAQSTGAYTPDAFATEGFIHCSYPRQVIAVAEAKFRGHHDLVLLGIDRSQLTCQVLDENLVGGFDQFPHIYGPVPVDAVAEVIPFPCQVDGRFTLPSELQA